MSQRRNMEDMVRLSEHVRKLGTKHRDTLKRELRPAKWRRRAHSNACGSRSHHTPGKAPRRVVPWPSTPTLKLVPAIHPPSLSTVRHQIHCFSPNFSKPPPKRVA